MFWVLLQPTALVGVGVANGAKVVVLGFLANRSLNLEVTVACSDVAGGLPLSRYWLAALGRQAACSHGWVKNYQTCCSCQAAGLSGQSYIDGYRIEQRGHGSRYSLWHETLHVHKICVLEPCFIIPFLQ